MTAASLGRAPKQQSQTTDTGTTGVWQTIRALHARLTERKLEEHRKSEEQRAAALREVREHLNSTNACVDWRSIADSRQVGALRKRLGLPSLYLPWYVWLICGVVLTGVINSVIHVFLLALVLGAALTTVIRAQVKKYSARTLAERIQCRILHFEKRDASEEYPLIFSGFKINASTIDVDDYEARLSFRNIELSDEGWGIGLYSASGDSHGFLARRQGEVSLEVWQQPLLKKSAKVLLPDADNLIGRERALMDRLRALGAELRKAEAIPDLDAAIPQWDDVVIDDDTLEHLLRAWVLFAHGDKAAPKGILLKGPPGTGKSLLSRIFSESSGANYVRLSVGDIKSENIGGTATNVKRIWSGARDSEPAIIFIDECEGVFVRRGSDQGDIFSNEAVQTFLAEWDGLRDTAGNKPSRVLVMAATNRADLLDDAIVSRFTDVIELRPAGHEQRPALVAAVARQLGVAVPDDAELLGDMGGLSGRDLRNVLQQAARLAAPDEPTATHFRTALRHVRGKGATRVDQSASWDTLALAPDLKQKLKTTCAMIREAEMLTSKGIPVPRTLMLYGPPGTGKTQIARTLANEAGVSFIARTTADLKGQYLGHSAARVAQTFESARATSPCILFIDEIDALTSSRGSGDSDALQQELLTQMLQELDGVGDKGGVVCVVAATNRLDQLDSAILSRFSQRMEIGMPDAAQRADIIRALLSGRPVAPEFAVDTVASRCDGLSGRDLRELITDGFNRAMERTAAAGKAAAEVMLLPEDVHAALEQARSKDVTRVAQSASWDTLALAPELKQKLKTTCAMVRESELLMVKGIPVPRTLMLYGPPGTGKTQIARTLANEAGVSFIARTTADLKGQYLGHAAARVAQTFESARAKSPCILFIDEIDALTASRGSGDSDVLQQELLTQMLQELDGVTEKGGIVFVVAATNRLDQLDAAILSRFGQRMEIGMPDAAQRADIIRALLIGRPVAPDCVTDEVAARCDGLSGRDLRELITDGFNRAVARTTAAGRPATDSLLQLEDIEASLGARELRNQAETMV